MEEGVVEDLVAIPSVAVVVVEGRGVGCLIQITIMKKMAGEVGGEDWYETLAQGLVAEGEAEDFTTRDHTTIMLAGEEWG